jgi:hypothetical protein
MKGIWFFGLSGSGKTYASEFIKKKIKKSILIDGDEVRKFISYDLGYTKRDRLTQIQRVSGLAKILVRQKYFPIISTVFFSKKIQNICQKINIIPIRIVSSDIKSIMNSHPTYKNSKDIVGKDIFYQKIITKKIINDGGKNFCKELNLLII